MAKSIIENLHTKIHKGFVLTDSLYASLGHSGIGHVLTKTSGSFKDLYSQLNDIIALAQSGQTIVSPSLCDFQMTTLNEKKEVTPDALKQELCARLFQLSVVTPMAIFNDIGSTDHLQPNALTTPLTADSILLSL